MSNESYVEYSYEITLQNHGQGDVIWSSGKMGSWECHDDEPWFAEGKAVDAAAEHKRKLDNAVAHLVRVDGILAMENPVFKTTVSWRNVTFAKGEWSEA